MSTLTAADFTDIEFREVAPNYVSYTEASFDEVEDDKEYKKMTVVYSQYNHESLLAAAIIKKEKPDVRVISFEDVLPDDTETVIWLGVKPMELYHNKSFKKIKSISIDSKQPCYHFPKRHNLLNRLMAKVGLTKEQMDDNALMEYVNGEMTEDVHFHDVQRVTLIDKAMFYFNIQNNGAYGYRYYSMLCSEWTKRELTEVEHSMMYSILKKAQNSITDNADFTTFVNITKAQDEFRDEVAKNYKRLETKSFMAKVPTDSGVQNVRIMNVDYKLYYLAKYYFTKQKIKCINIVHGINGSFFTGNVMLAKGVEYGNVSQYIDA